MKRRICSYDLAAVPKDGYVVTDDGGEIYLCNARCLCIWAVSLATKPGLSQELQARRLVLKVPGGKERAFPTMTGLNKGEAQNSLARAVFFNRLGEIPDRSFENQWHRASGLNLVVAAITLWNTVYLERATEQMAKSWQFDPALLQHVSPLGWEHINLTGDYTGHTNKRVAKGGFRPLRNPRNPSGTP
jgi:hypothetical protein